MSCMQAAVPLVASPTYANLYAATVQNFPGKALLIFSASVFK